MTPYAVGVDVGGTTIKAGLVELAGGIARQLTLPTPHDPAAVVAAALDCYRELAGADAGRYPLGVVVPGVVDDERRIGVLSANLGWRDADFGHLLDTATAPFPGLRCAFGHDVRAGLVAEMTYGAARGCKSVVFLPIGTGIAAALAVDGRPLVGGGFAGELGHLSLDPTGQVCGCGGRGCLETIASASAIAAQYTRRTGREVDGARGVFAARAAGDLQADAVVRQALQALGCALATTLTLVGPAHIVVGGGLALAGQPLADELASYIHLPFTPLPPVRVTELGDRAALMGAAVLARRATAD